MKFDGGVICIIFMRSFIDVSNEDDCLKQLETIKEDFVRTVSVSDGSLNKTTDIGGIISIHDDILLCCIRRISGSTRTPVEIEYY